MLLPVIEGDEGVGGGERCNRVVRGVGGGERCNRVLRVMGEGVGEV